MGCEGAAEWSAEGRADRDHGRTIADCLRELGDYGAGRGVEIWMEVHGARTQEPPRFGGDHAGRHTTNGGLCWNSNPTDMVNGSVKPSFDLLRPWIKNVHINELADDNIRGASCSTAAAIEL